ncbi:MAG TPA: choice-of-anchor D domain-containing protein, partial [Archangium sp.]
MRKIIPTLLTAALVFSCESCRMGGPQGTTPDFVPTPTAISFSACPTRDESGAAVQDVFPDLKKLSILNQGTVSGELALSISGAGASSFTLGSGLPTDIARQSTVEIPISFSPTARGDVRAELLIDDKIDETMNPVVTLIGTGYNLPAQPSIETGPQKGDKSGFFTCTAETPLSECELAFPDTLMDQSATLQLKIRNKGCPALKITSIEIDGSTNPGTSDGFTLEGIAPSTVSPMVLSTADGTDETIVNIRFNAVDDGSGATSQQHFAVITLKSNDPINGDGFANPARLTLTANAIKPSIYVSPTSCNYSNSMDNCGNTPRVANKASFRVSNDGSTPISISSVKFRSSGGTTSSDSRFSITQNIQGQTIQPTASATIEVTEVDQPLLVSDQLEIVSDIPGMGAGSGGSVVVSVISGIKPCITTNPADKVDFGDPMEELTARRIIIRNGASCGTLRLDGLTINSPSTPFFTFLDPT